MEIVPRSENDYIINAKASKGKKQEVFNDEILISTTDADRLKKYSKDNVSVTMHQQQLLNNLYLYVP